MDTTSSKAIVTTSKVIVTASNVIVTNSLNRRYRQYLPFSVVEGNLQLNMLLIILMLGLATKVVNGSCPTIHPQNRHNVLTATINDKPLTVQEGTTVDLLCKSHGSKEMNITFMPSRGNNLTMELQGPPYVLVYRSELVSSPEQYAFRKLSNYCNLFTIMRVGIIHNGLFRCIQGRNVKDIEMKVTNNQLKTDPQRAPNRSGSGCSETQSHADEILTGTHISSTTSEAVPKHASSRTLAAFLILLYHTLSY